MARSRFFHGHYLPIEARVNRWGLDRCIHSFVAFFSAASDTEGEGAADRTPRGRQLSKFGDSAKHLVVP